MVRAVDHRAAGGRAAPGEGLEGVRLSETLLAYSVEGFLSDAEADAVAGAFAGLDPARHAAGADGRSVHRIDGLGTPETVAVYEPSGRIEVVDVPDAVRAIMDAAFYRRLADLRRAYPSARRPDCWIYLEYGPGQFITPHVDYAINEARPAQPKICGLSVLLSDAHQGGEFFVETAGSSQLWEQGDGPPAIAAGANEHSEWFRRLPRTRWTARPARGTALFYGSQLVHGTLPVTSGRVKKMIGFVTA